MLDKHLFKSKINKLKNKDYLFDLYAKFSIYQDYGLLTEFTFIPYIDSLKISSNTEIVLYFESHYFLHYYSLLQRNLNKSLQYTKKLEEQDLFSGIDRRYY